MKTMLSDITRGMKLMSVVVALLFVESAATLFASVRLPQLVADKMVLQRDTELKIWGWADVGEKVTVRFDGKHYFTQADEQGKWCVMLPPHAAGGPYKMEVNEKVIRDILVGDVWLMSGQSNQETPIKRLVEKFPEIENSNNSMIRHFKVPTQDSKMEPKVDLAQGGVWYSAVASEVLNWTSLAYFFACEAYAHTKLPVGVIVSSLGGSAIQSWVSQEHLKVMPKYVVNQDAWLKDKEARRDKGLGLWMKHDLDDSQWKETQVPGTWRARGFNTRGSIWYRKHFTCPASMVGRHARIYMGRMADDDRVYVNGVEVGHTAYFGPPRKYDIPAGVLKQGDNVVTLRLEAKNGGGEIVEDKPYYILGDEDKVNLEGRWKYRVGYDLRDADAFKDELKNMRRVGSGLYNGMIYPIKDWCVKGVVWYQGESNTGAPGDYYVMMKALIDNWRQDWHNAQLPFFLVQLPNYMTEADKPTDTGWARLRDAQLQAAKNISNTSLATTYDVGEWNDIHPLNKKAVALRLFLGARKLAYGERVQASGPIYEKMEIKGNKIILSFSECGKGLVAQGGGALKYFTIAGADKKFVWAKASIKGNKVEVYSPEVAAPVAVRYAWADNPMGANLANKNGLLASPFRTDDWGGATIARQVDFGSQP